MNSCRIFGRLASVVAIGCILLSTHPVFGQNQHIQWHIGYAAPFFTNVGAELGVSFDIPSSQPDSANTSARPFTLRLLPQVRYFQQLDVQHNFMFDPTLEFVWQRKARKIYPIFSVGLGYIMAFQRQDGTLDLATGNIDYNSEVIHSFVPSINIGFASVPKKRIGYYFKTSYGRSMVVAAQDAAFFGVSFGITFTPQSQNSAL